MNLPKMILGLAVFTGATAVAYYSAKKSQDNIDKASKLKMEMEYGFSMGEMPDDLGDIAPETPEMAEPAELVYPTTHETVIVHPVKTSGPNVNPVDTAAKTTHHTPVLDPMKIACAEDFQNWDELGCQS